MYKWGHTSKLHIVCCPIPIYHHHERIGLFDFQISSIYALHYIKVTYYMINLGGHWPRIGVWGCAALKTPFSRLSCSSQGSHFKQKSQFTRPKLEILASTASIFTQILAHMLPNLEIFSSQAPKFGNFQFTSPQIWKFSAHEPQIWKFSVHKPPFSEANISLQAPHFGNPGRTPLPEKKLSAPPGDKPTVVTEAYTALRKCHFEVSCWCLCNETWDHWTSFWYTLQYCIFDCLIYFWPCTQQSHCFISSHVHEIGLYMYLKNKLKAMFYSSHAICASKIPHIPLFQQICHQKTKVLHVVFVYPTILPLSGGGGGA